MTIVGKLMIFAPLHITAGVGSDVRAILTCHHTRKGAEVSGKMLHKNNDGKKGRGLGLKGTLYGVCWFPYEHVIEF